MPADDAGVITPALEPDTGDDGRGLLARLPFARSRTARRIVVLVPWLAAGLWIAWSLSNHFHDMPWGPGWEDAYVYQRAADAFVAHPAQLYDKAHEQLASTHAQAAFIYPPSGLIPFLPLVPLATGVAGPTGHGAEVMAASIWTVVDLTCLFGALALFGRRAGLGPGRLGIAVFLVSLTAPPLIEIKSGQVNGLELLLLVLAWERMPRASGGVLFGLAIALKPVAALFLLALVLRRRWHTLGAALGTLAVVTLPFALLIGVDGVRYYVTQVGPFMLRQDTWDGANLSLNAITQTFIGGRGVTDHDPRTLAPLVSAALALAVLVALRVGLAAGVALAVARGRLQNHLELAVLLATIPLTAGTVWIHYYVYVVPLALVAMTATSVVLRRAAWVLVLPALFNGFLVTWIDDPFEAENNLERIAFAKAQLLPLLTLGLLAVIVARVMRSRETFASAAAGGPPPPAPPAHAARVRVAAETCDVVSVTGRASEPAVLR